MSRETVQQLRVHIARRLSIQVWLPALTSGGSQPPITTDSKDLMPLAFTGTWAHVNTEKTVINNNIKLITTIIIKTYLKGTFGIGFNP